MSEGDQSGMAIPFSAKADSIRLISERDGSVLPKTIHEAWPGLMPHILEISARETGTSERRLQNFSLCSALPCFLRNVSRMCSQCSAVFFRPFNLIRAAAAAIGCILLKCALHLSLDRWATLILALVLFVCGMPRCGWFSCIFLICRAFHIGLEKSLLFLSEMPFLCRSSKRYPVAPSPPSVRLNNLIPANLAVLMAPVSSSHPSPSHNWMTLIIGGCPRSINERIHRDFSDLRRLFRALIIWRVSLVCGLNIVLPIYLIAPSGSQRA